MSLITNSKPLYLLVINKIKEDIETGIIQYGTRLPSEFELAKELGVSRATLREALRILEEDNVITRKHGIGTFVNTRPTFTSGIEELLSITQMIEHNKQIAGTIYLNIDRVLTTDANIREFKLEKEESILKIERIRTADNEPLVYCIDKIPESILPNNFNFQKDSSLFKTLEEQTNLYITYAITEILPLGFHAKISPLLHSPSESSLLVLKQVHYDKADRPVLISINYFRADKFRFKVLRRR